MRILIVEDDFFNRKVMMGYLKKYGELDIAATGVEAVAAFKESLTSNVSYDLICLDIMMPEMDGQEALKHIRKLEEQAGLNEDQKVKIFMMTALSDKESVLKAARLHCDAYLIKPIRLDKLQGEMTMQGLIQVSETSNEVTDDE